MITDKPTPQTNFVILRGIEEGNRFFSNYRPNIDHTKLANGDRAYTILGYAETIAEIQVFLYGRTFEGGQ